MSENLSFAGYIFDNDLTFKHNTTLTQIRTTYQKRCYKLVFLSIDNPLQNTLRKIKIPSNHAKDCLKTFLFLLTFLTMIQLSEHSATLTQVRTTYQKRRHKLAFLSIDNLLQNTWRKIKKSSKFRQDRETLISGFVYFLNISTFFCRGGWTLNCVLTKFLDFAKFFLFPKAVQQLLRELVTRFTCCERNVFSFSNFEIMQSNYAKDCRYFALPNIMSVVLLHTEITLFVNVALKIMVTFAILQ